MKTGLGSSLKAGAAKLRAGSAGLPPQRHLPFSLEDLEIVSLTDQGRNDWKNIPDTLRQAILGIVQSMQDQDRDFHEYKSENSLLQFRREMREELETKANLEDVKQTLDHVAETVDEKVSRAEVQSLLVGLVREEQLHAEVEQRPTRSELLKAIDTKMEEEDFKVEFGRLHERVDRLNNDIQSLHTSTVSTYDYSTLKDRVDRKADIELLKEGLRNKINSDEFAAAMAKKAEFEDFEEILERKVDGQDLKQIIEAIEKKADLESIEEMVEIIRSKADIKDFEMLSVAMNKKADKKSCDDGYQQGQALRKEVENLFVDLETTLDDFRSLLEKQKLDMDNIAKELIKKVGKAEIAEIKLILPKKIEASMFVEELTKVKDEIIKDAKNTKAELDKVLIS